MANIEPMVNGHESEQGTESKKHDTKTMAGMEIKIEDLDKNLRVPSSSLRTITITKIEERNEQHRLSKSHYTVYTIQSSPPIVDGIDISVCRRYNDFKWLRKVLIACFPSIFIPPIPPPQMIGRFNKKFTEQRKQDLERFLNRICSIKPLSESLVLAIFLSRPEKTFNVSKDEIRRNHIPTTKKKTQFMSKTFPYFMVNNPLIEQYNNEIEIDLLNNKWISNEEIIKYKTESDDIIFGNDIKNTNEFLKKICNKMGHLCEVIKKLNGKLYKLSVHTKKFHEGYWRLHSKNNEYKFNCDLNKNEELTIFGDDKRDFYGWYNYNKGVYDVQCDILYKNLIYQYQDINAFMDIFVNRNKYLVQFKNVLGRNKNWQNLIDLKYDLQPHQTTQIQMDYKQEKMLRSFLLINTKIIINYGLHKIWKQIIGDWENMMGKYAQRQLLIHQILFAESYQDNGSDYDDDYADNNNKEEEEKSVSDILNEDDNVECWQYEPVFDDDDSRQYNRNHAEKELIEQKQESIDEETILHQPNVVNTNNVRQVN